MKARKKNNKRTLCILKNTIDKNFEKGDYIVIVDKIDMLGFFKVKRCNKKKQILGNVVAWALADDLDIL